MDNKEKIRLYIREILAEAFGDEEFEEFDHFSAHDQFDAETEDANIDDENDVERFLGAEKPKKTKQDLDRSKMTPDEQTAFDILSNPDPALIAHSLINAPKSSLVLKFAKIMHGLKNKEPKKFAAITDELIKIFQTEQSEQSKVINFFANYYVGAGYEQGNSLISNLLRKYPGHEDKVVEAVNDNIAKALTNYKEAGRDIDSFLFRVANNDIINKLNKEKKTKSVTSSLDAPISDKGAATRGSKIADDPDADFSDLGDTDFSDDFESPADINVDFDGKGSPTTQYDDDYAELIDKYGQVRADDIIQSRKAQEIYKRLQTIKEEFFDFYSKKASPGNVRWYEDLYIDNEIGKDLLNKLNNWKRYQKTESFKYTLAKDILGLSDEEIENYFIKRGKKEVVKGRNEELINQLKTRFASDDQRKIIDLINSPNLMIPTEVQQDETGKEVKKEKPVLLSDLLTNDKLVNTILGKLVVKMNGAVYNTIANKLGEGWGIEFAYDKIKQQFPQLKSSSPEFKQRMKDMISALKYAPEASTVKTKDTVGGFPVMEEKQPLNEVAEKLKKLATYKERRFE